MWFSQRQPTNWPPQESRKLWVLLREGTVIHFILASLCSSKCWSKAASKITLFWHQIWSLLFSIYFLTSISVTFSKNCNRMVVVEGGSSYTNIPIFKETASHCCVIAFKCGCTQKVWTMEDKLHSHWKKKKATLQLSTIPVLPSCTGHVIWSHSLRISVQAVEPQYQVPTHKSPHPVVDNSPCF